MNEAQPLFRGCRNIESEHESVLQSHLGADSLIRLASLMPSIASDARGALHACTLFPPPPRASKSLISTPSHMFRPQNGNAYMSPSRESRDQTRCRQLCCYPRSLHPRDHHQSATYLKWWAVFTLLAGSDFWTAHDLRIGLRSPRGLQSIGLSPSQMRHHGRTSRDMRKSTSLLVGPISRDRFCGSGTG